MDSLDDLASFGVASLDEGEKQYLDADERDSNNGSNTVPVASPPIDYVYSPIGLTIPNTDLPGDDRSSAGGGDDRSTSDGGRNHSHSVHSSVHMHVQENAKIPHLYDQSVDRSNSSNNRTNYRNRPRPDNNNLVTTTAAAAANDNDNNSLAMDMTLTGTTSDIMGDDNNSLLGNFSMAEIFLNKESTHRRSLDLNYEYLGLLPVDTRFDVQRRLSGDGTGSNDSLKTSKDAVEDVQMEIEALTAAAIDPTPWSEIEGKMHADEAKARMKSYHHHRSTQPSAAQTLQQQNHPHHSSYYPYGRHHQLPIPEKPTSPKTDLVANTLPGNSALATAAAIAATTATNVDVGIPALESQSLITTSTVLTLPGPHVQQQQIFQAGITTATQPTSTTNAINQQPPPSPAASFSSSSLTNRHFQRQRGFTTVPPQHAAAHTTNRASVLAAANKKSQYGFGGNHTIPSVPAPPRIRSPWKVANPLVDHHQTTNNATMKKAVGTNGIAVMNGGGVTSKQAASAPKLPMPTQGMPMATTATGAATSTFLPPKSTTPTDATSSNDDNGNTGAAYERKKQRAKNARIKLNESIERLHIAMGLAGSQSRQRIQQLESGTLVETESRQKSIHINHECIRLADQAKKWDRPSFVGTAASLIQSLNAECESLMSEMGAMQALLETQTLVPGNGAGAVHAGAQNDLASTAAADMVAPLGTATEAGANERAAAMSLSLMDANGSDATVAAAGVAPPASSTLNPTMYQENKRQEHPIMAEAIETSSKRPRVERAYPDPPSMSGFGSNEIVSAQNEKTVFNAVAKVLDPMTLCQCRMVSKRWNELPGFQDEDLWLSLAVKRFGFYNVRQWNEKMEDAENGGGKVSSMKLYKEMNVANVMPHFYHEGTSLLGDAKIPGRISSWAFIVERSNGETLRSVRREPGDTGVGGSYHSRPVVELRIVIQNTGMASQTVLLKKQQVTVDVSTRRSGGELKEIDWDDRFRKVVRNLDGTVRRPVACISNSEDTLCRLDLFETVVLEVHINARGCSTTSKFQQRSNFTKILVTLDGTTVPMVVPFFRDHHHGMH